MKKKFNWARWIRENRELCGLTQGELGELLGTNKQHVYKWEAGLNIPGKFYQDELKRVLL